MTLHMTVMSAPTLSGQSDYVNITEHKPNYINLSSFAPSSYQISILDLGLSAIPCHTIKPPHLREAFVKYSSLMHSHITPSSQDTYHPFKDKSIFFI